MTQKETMNEKAEEKAPVKTAKPVSKPKEQASLRYVKHNPMELFSARVISRSDWVSGGITDQGDVEWNELNRFRVPVSQFSPAALNYLTKVDDGFEIVSE